MLTWEDHKISVPFPTRWSTGQLYRHLSQKGLPIKSKNHKQTGNDIRIKIKLVREKRKNKRMMCASW